MRTKWILDMFDKERTWLEDQPDMTPWEEGCHGLAEQLQQWLEAYSKSICDAVVNDDHEAWSEHVERLWQCLAYHWQQAAEANGGIEAQAVAKQIQSGRGYQRGGRLGGDPMHAVVLAVAMTSRDGKAPTVFHQDYYAFSRGLAGKLNPRLADNPDEWWNDMVDHLAGYTKPPGRLTRFFGRCGLQNWLGIVQRNFLKRWIRREWKLTDFAEVEDQEQTHMSTDVGAAANESLQCFVEVVRQALAALSKDDVLLLYYLYVKGLKQKDVATIIRIAPGNVTRRRQNALERLKDQIEQAATRLFGESNSGRFQEEIMEDPKAFAEGLRKAIEDMQEDKS